MVAYVIQSVGALTRRVKHERKSHTETVKKQNKKTLTVR